MPIRRLSSPKARFFSSSARCCCPPTTFSTNLAISNPRTPSTSFRFGTEQLGITICEDAWNDKNFWPQRLYDRDPVAELVGKGSTILLNISSPLTRSTSALSGTICCGPSPANIACPVVYVNQVGGNDSLMFDGSSVAFMPDGRIAARAKSFEEDLVYFDTVTGHGDVRPAVEDELDAAYRALVLGTRDYVRKCGFRKVVIGLSGGVDSALVAAIAADALGRGKRTGRCACRARIPRRAAFATRKQLAENLGIEFLSFPSARPSRAYRKISRTTFQGLPEDVNRRKPSGADPG